MALIDKCIGALGALELLLAMKMSGVNMEQMAIARKAENPKAAAASFLQSRYYKAWSRAQLNNTEYAPMLCVLMLLIRMKAARTGRALNAVERGSCVGAVLSSLVFVYAVATQGKVDVANMRPGQAGMSPLRPLGALARYLAMGGLVWCAARDDSNDEVKC